MVDYDFCTRIVGAAARRQDSEATASKNQLGINGRQDARREAAGRSPRPRGGASGRSTEGIAEEAEGEEAEARSEGMLSYPSQDPLQFLDEFDLLADDEAAEEAPDEERAAESDEGNDDANERQQPPQYNL